MQVRLFLLLLGTVLCPLVTWPLYFRIFRVKCAFFLSLLLFQNYSIINWLAMFRFLMHIFVFACFFYLGGVFKLELFLPEEYPMAAPKVLELKNILLVI